MNELAPRKVISPTQAIKLIGADHKVFKPYIVIDDDGNEVTVKLIHKPQGKPVLVEGSDGRAPYKVSTDELDDVEDNDTSWLD